MLALVEVPEHRLAVLATRRAERAIRRHGDRVEVLGVTEVIVLELAVGQAPDLHNTVPAARHDDRVGRGRREPNARHPVGVALLGDGVLALAEGVPELDGSANQELHTH